MAFAGMKPSLKHRSPPGAAKKVEQDQQVKDRVIKIGNDPVLPFGEKAHRILKAGVIGSQLFPGGAEERIPPVAQKLHGKPKNQNARQKPFTNERKAIEANQPHAEKTQHEKLRAADAHAFHQHSAAQTISGNAAEKPKP